MVITFPHPMNIEATLDKISEVPGMISIPDVPLHNGLENHLHGVHHQAMITFEETSKVLTPKATAVCGEDHLINFLSIWYRFRSMQHTGMLLMRRK